MSNATSGFWKICDLKRDRCLKNCWTTWIILSTIWQWYLKPLSMPSLIEIILGTRNDACLCLPTAWRFIRRGSAQLPHHRFHGDDLHAAQRSHRRQPVRPILSGRRAIVWQNQLMDKRGAGVRLILKRSEVISGKRPIYENSSDMELKLAIFAEPRHQIKCAHEATCSFNAINWSPLASAAC